MINILLDHENLPIVTICIFLSPPHFPRTRLIEHVEKYVWLVRLFTNCSINELEYKQLLGGA